MVPALRLLFCNHPTRVATMLLTAPKSPGCSTSIPRVDSLNVNQHACGGNRLSLMGASSVCLAVVPCLASPNSFFRNGIHCYAARSIFTASSQVARPSPSLRVQLPLTMSPALASIGLSTSLVGPMSFSLEVMVEELDPAVVLRLPLHTDRTAPV